MDDPIAGWKVLLETLKPGGLMLIGLYSKLGRNRVAEMQKDLKRTIDPSDDNAIQSYRSSVIASDREFDKKVRSYNFFFSMSEFKDLLFPAQEHLFTILEISKYLDKLGLKFCGFSDAQIIEKFKQKNKGKGNCYDLNKWADYELDNTSVFKNMYTFWCQKVS